MDGMISSALSDITSWRIFYNGIPGLNGGAVCHLGSSPSSIAFCLAGNVADGGDAGSPSMTLSSGAAVDRGVLDFDDGPGVVVIIVLVDSSLA